ncbi:MAG: DUF6364 family protein [Acidobacteriia bacterium]|nr:DUF6364 family protein [Terriglobia bacterium]
MPKLTLSIEGAVIERAKRYAKARRTSVSELVETYLDILSKPIKPVDAPVLRSLRGTLKRADLKDYRKYLARKYR